MAMWMNVNIHPGHQTNEIYFDFFISMWYIKFSAYLIDWKDIPSIQIHLTILCVFSTKLYSSKDTEIKWEEEEHLPKKEKKEIHTETYAKSFEFFLFFLCVLFPFIFFQYIGKR